MSRRGRSIHSPISYSNLGCLVTRPSINQMRVSPLNNFQRGKRVSKVRVLQKAIDYICNMHQMIREFDGNTSSSIGGGGNDGNNNHSVETSANYVDDSHLFDF